MEEAERLILKDVELAATELVALDRAAGRVLREDVRADRDFPPFDRVAMDGAALRSSDCARGVTHFAVQETTAAGQARVALREPDACVEVMTGGVLPSDADCVVPVEHYARGPDSITFLPGTAPRSMQNVHVQGSDYRDGALLVPQGTRLGAPEVAVCAAVGKTSLSVSRLPRIALVVTGDELVDVDQVPAPHQIRMTNSYAMEAALGARGFLCARRLHLRDDPATMREALADILQANDVIVISGGVSAGKFDHLPALLPELGVRALFHGVRQRPGRPFWFGRTGEGKPLFALPGNPVSALACCCRYVIPTLEAGLGLEPPRTTERAILAANVEGLADRVLFLPVAVEVDATGQLLAHPRPVSGSADFASLVKSRGFVEVPAGKGPWSAGTALALYRWTWS